MIVCLILIAKASESKVDFYLLIKVVSRVLLFVRELIGWFSGMAWLNAFYFEAVI